MLEKVIENWTSRLDYIRASHGSHMPEISSKKLLTIGITRCCYGYEIIRAAEDIYDTLNLKGNLSLAESKNENITTKPHPKTAQTQATIKKVMSLILKEQPLTQRFIVSKTGMCLPALKKLGTLEGRELSQYCPYLRYSNVNRLQSNVRITLKLMSILTLLRPIIKGAAAAR
ncbi:hypothetical protein TNCV_4393121 [Trichonephila clavipes]|nr:hypothetical protein TNCV_4393121 [Trichonephila clavipes]